MQVQDATGIARSDPNVCLKRRPVIEIAFLLYFKEPQIL
jgi:hypothetical protein